LVFLRRLLYLDINFKLKLISVGLITGCMEGFTDRPLMRSLDCSMRFPELAGAVDPWCPSFGDLSRTSHHVGSAGI
jgi:hypothetical protein